MDVLLIKTSDSGDHTVRRLIITTLSLFLLIAAPGCKKSTSDNDNSSDDSTPSAEVDLESDCGVVIDDERKFTILEEDQREVESIDVISSELVVVNWSIPSDDDEQDPQTGTQLVMLQGVTTNGVRDFLTNQGVRTIETLIGPGATFISAGDECQIRTDGGGRGVIGQLFSRTGQSIVETLIEDGSVVPTADPCGGELLQECYSNIDVLEPESRFSVGKFLWKPVAERDGNLVVLFDVDGGFPDVRVEIDGSELTDFGASNGYDHTFRANRSGCSFGSATVRVTDQTGAPVLYEGSETIEIPNGCRRVELNF